MGVKKGDKNLVLIIRQADWVCGKRTDTNLVLIIKQRKIGGKKRRHKSCVDDQRQIGCEKRTDTNLVLIIR